MDSSLHANTDGAFSFSAVGLLSVSEGALQLEPMNSRLCEHDDANAAHLGIAGLPSMLPLMSLSTPLIMQPAQQGCGGSGGFTLANQGNHNHGHTHAIQLQTSLEMGPVVCPALCEIRTQLQELTRSVESCQNEVRSDNCWNDSLLFFFLVPISFHFFFAGFISSPR